jgi:hypothetical protein
LQDYLLKTDLLSIPRMQVKRISEGNLFYCSFSVSWAKELNCLIELRICQKKTLQVCFEQLFFFNWPFFRNSDQLRPFFAAISRRISHWEKYALLSHAPE